MKRGWCNGHYQRWRRTGDPVKPASSWTPAECSIPGCPRTAWARGWCGAHYRRWSTTGDPLGSTRPTDEERFWRRVSKSSGCWIWTGHRNPSGYGLTNWNKRQGLAHRYSWELHNGPIPDGLVVMHRCDVRPCVNPAHLTIGTQADNMADARAKGRATNPPKRVR